MKELKDKDFSSMLERLDVNHIASAFAIFADETAAGRFEEYLVKHGYAFMTTVLFTEEGLKLNKVVYWKRR